MASKAAPGFGKNSAAGYFVKKILKFACRINLLSLFITGMPDLVILVGILHKKYRVD